MNKSLSFFRQAATKEKPNYTGERNMANVSKKYQQAAITYFVYGVIYLIGAIYIGSIGLSDKTAGPGGGLAYYLMGAAFVVIFPILIWKEFKWFTRILAIFMAYRIYGLIMVLVNDTGKMAALPWGGEVSLQTGGIIFIAVAAVTCFMLARAGWDL